MSAVKKEVGPETYSPKKAQDSHIGTIIGKSERKDLASTNLVTPAPNHY